MRTNFLKWVGGAVVAFAALAGDASAGALNAGASELARAASQADLKGADVIYTTFYPTAYFAQRIAQGKVPVKCPVPEDADPIFWQPSGALVAEYQAAGLIVLNGAEYEKWVTKASLPLSRVVDTARAFEKDFIKFPGVTHSHGAAGSHSHEGIDGHTWMDPVQATKQAEQILIAMERRWPAHREAFRKGYEGLAADLAKLDARITKIEGALKGVKLISSHPAYGYIAKRHGLEISVVDLPPDEAPSETEWTKLEAALKPTDARPVVLLFESQPKAEIVERLKKLGVRAVVFDPCETLGVESAKSRADYLSVMNGNIDALAGAVGLSKSGEKPETK